MPSLIMRGNIVKVVFLIHLYHRLKIHTAIQIGNDQRGNHCFRHQQREKCKPMKRMKLALGQAWGTTGDRHYLKIQTLRPCWSSQYWEVISVNLLRYLYIYNQGLKLFMFLQSYFLGIRLQKITRYHSDCRTKHRESRDTSQGPGHSVSLTPNTSTTWMMAMGLEGTWGIGCSLELRLFDGLTRCEE